MVTCHKIFGLFILLRFVLGNVGKANKALFLAPCVVFTSY